MSSDINYTNMISNKNINNIFKTPFHKKEMEQIMNFYENNVIDNIDKFYIKTTEILINGKKYLIDDNNIIWNYSNEIEGQYIDNKLFKR